MWFYLGQKYSLKNWHESFFFNLLLLLLFFTFWPHCTACGLLTPWPGVEPGLPALEAPSINHWSAREAPTCIILNNITIQNYYDIYFKFLVKNYLFYMTPSPSLVDFFLFKNFILYWGTILLTNVCIVKAMVFPAVMYGCELYHKEGWAPKNWCFWTVVLEKPLESLGLQDQTRAS